jgi:MYXO-CTERM domain-containing protein
MHAGTMDCGTAIMPDNPSSCTASEYGSRISPMGGACLHLNAFDKWYQGIFGRCNGVRVPSTGTFTLLPIEIPCDGVQALQIPMPKTRSFSNGGSGAVTLSRYYLELRTKRGLDDKSAIAGPSVWVHVAGDFGAANRSSTFDWVLDMNPSTSAFDGMTVGQTYDDPAGGVSFTVQAMDNDHATINVSIANGSGSPTCMDGTAFTAPGPTSCGTSTGGTGGMGGMGAGGMGGRGGAGMGGRGGMTGTGGAAGRAGAPAGGMGGAPQGGSGGIGGDGVAGTPGGGAAGLGGTGGSLIAGGGGLPAAGSAGAAVTGGAGAGVSGSAGAGISGTGGSATATGGSVAGGAGPAAGTGPGPVAAAEPIEDPGCGCRTVPSNRASSTLWGLALIGLGLMRRRRAR